MDMSEVCRMARDEIIDYAAVLPQHVAVHARLENWTRWCRGTGSGGESSPMFRLYRSAARAREYAVSINPVDGTDAQVVQKMVSHLPTRQRLALVWCYVNNSINPRSMAGTLGTSKQGLLELVHEARTMLVNRGA